MIRSILLSLLGGMLLASCQSEVDEFKPDYVVPIPRGNILNYYSLQPGEIDSVFQLVGTTGQVNQVRSETGVLIEIPDQAWTTAGGTVIDDGYVLHWKEVRTLADQVNRHLSMRSYTDQVRSNKIFQLTAYKEGEALILTKDILVRWPEVSSGALMMYQGSRPTPWAFRWQEAPQGQLSLTNWIDPVNGAGVNGYLMAIPSAGTWCAGEKMELNPVDPDIQVQLPDGFAESNTAVYWLESGHSYALDYQGGGVFRIEDIPVGKTGRLFCVTEAVQNNYYAAWADQSITAGGYTWTPVPEKRSLGLVRLMLESL